MDIQQIYEKLKAEFEDAIIELGGEAPSDQWIQVDPEKIVDICIYLRDSGTMLFDYMVNLSGMDYGDNFGVVYHLYSVKYGYRTVLKVMLDKETPKVPTVERVWKTANWHEREAYDMFGIDFEGHPNLIRILCCYDWEGYPLRKDYKVQEEYHGIKVPY